MIVALCTTCRGRVQHLRETLPRNLADNPGPDTRFVVLDYNSEDGLGNFIQSTFPDELAAGKLAYYRFNDAARFKMAHAKNMAHRAALREGADILVNLDADNFTGPGFADYVRGAFNRTRHDPQEIFMWSRMVKWGKMPRGISGRIAVTRNAFLISGGYDEKYADYSPDDKDFNLRLRRLGYCAQEVHERFLLGLTHNDAIRFKEYPEAAGNLDGSVCQISRVVNDGRIGCGTVFRNFDPTPINLDPVPTRLFGIGMHKTATRSLHVALTRLGFKSGHWENAHWAKAAWIEMTHLGKSLSLERFYAVSDTPIPQLYQALDRAYPGSKFILTVRDEASWLESACKHFDPAYNPFAAEWDTDPFTHRMHRLIYGLHKFDRDAFLLAYRRHNASVMEYFKDRPSDLMVMDMSARHGWPELCRFLGVPIHPGEYPTAGETPSAPADPLATTDLPPDPQPNPSENYYSSP